VIDASIVWCAAGEERQTEEQQKCSDLLALLHERSYKKPRILVYAPPIFFTEVKGASKRGHRPPLKFIINYSPDKPKWGDVEKNHGDCKEAERLKQKKDWDYVVVALAKREEAGAKVALLTTDSHFYEVKDKLRQKGIEVINPAGAWEPCKRRW